MVEEEGAGWNVKAQFILLPVSLVTDDWWQKMFVKLEWQLVTSHRALE